MYATHHPWQSTASGILGLRRWNYSAEPTLVLGSLFVQKYGLRIEYLPKGGQDDPSQRLFIGYLYTRIEKNYEVTIWRSLVSQALIFTIIALLLHQIIKVKQERLVREKQHIIEVYDQDDK